MKANITKLQFHDIEKKANEALENTKLHFNHEVKERELMLGKRAFINGAIWMQDRYVYEINKFNSDK